MGLHKTVLRSRFSVAATKSGDEPARDYSIGETRDHKVGERRDHKIGARDYKVG